MPKGVYDRSKTKAQRSAEKKNAAPAVEASAGTPAKAKKLGRRAKVAHIPAPHWSPPGAAVINNYEHHQKLQTLMGIYTSLTAGLSHLGNHAPDLNINAQRAINNTVVRIEVLSEALMPLEQAHGIKKQAAAEPEAEEKTPGKIKLTVEDAPSIEERAEAKVVEKAHKATNGTPAPVPVPVPVPVAFNNPS